eukprot:11462846-Alexandrium_andersonii.AAC.1
MEQEMQRRTGRNATGMRTRTWDSPRAGHARACSFARHGRYGWSYTETTSRHWGRMRYWIGTGRAYRHACRPR